MSDLIPVRLLEERLSLSLRARAHVCVCVLEEHFVLSQCCKESSLQGYTWNLMTFMWMSID